MTATDTVSRPGAGRERSRLPRLDGLRGLCAVLVVVFHIAYQAGVSQHIDDSGAGIWGFITEGLGVALPPFYVLSGMLLYKSFARAILTDRPRPSARRFYVGRALRILPAYWVLTAFALLAINFHSLHSVWDVLKPVLLLHFVTTRDPANWLVGMEPTWTVPAEVFFYLLLPVFGWLISRYARGATDPARRVRRMLVPLVTLVLIGAAWTAFAFLPATTLSGGTWYYNFWPFGFIGFFAAGMALATVSAYIEVTGRTPSLYRLLARRPNLCWLLAAAVFVANVPKPLGEPGLGTWGALGQEMIEHALLMAFSVLAVLPLTVPGLRSRFIDATLTNPPIQWLGRISYGIYLWHVPLIHVWFKNGNIFGNQPVPSEAFRGQNGFWELLAIVLGGTLVIATASYHLIEQPINRVRARMNERPRAEQAAPPAAAPDGSAEQQAA